jgi:hypothetical protein
MPSLSILLLATLMLGTPTLGAQVTLFGRKRDGERDNIGSSLQKANKARILSYYLPPNPVQDAKNATGDGYHSDGKLLLIFLQ